MANFKVGDRVRTVDAFSSVPKGHGATIVEHEGSIWERAWERDGGVHVKWDKGTSQCDGGYFASHFELIPTEVPKPSKYWMVHNGSNPTNHKHTSKDLAIGEAARLARLNPGKKFWVLETVHTAQVPEAPVQHTSL